jgi:hypothetical protein
MFITGKVKVTQPMTPTFKFALAAVWIVAFATVGLSAHAVTVEQCKSLAAQDFGSIPDAPTRVTAATVVPASGEVPSYCRIEAYISPQVGFEGHYPLETWNGKLLMTGCGAMCGNLAQGLSSCPDALARGFACATTDMGHKAPMQDGKWAYNNPLAEIDVGHRATHVATVVGKHLVKVLYGSEARKSYFRGCSTGGRQALVAANRYPLDYDGIIAGASVLYAPFGPPLQLFWDSTANIGSDGKTIMDPKKIVLLAKAALDACDLVGDGVKDGVISDPWSCKFKPEELKCTGAEATDCLTEADLGVVNKIYGGPRNSKGPFKRIPGQLPGTEMDWVGFLSGKGSANYNWASENLRYLAFPIDPGPGYDVSMFDWERDPQRLSYSHMTAANPDLELFADNGGKLIMFHGVSDPAITSSVSKMHYELITRTMGGSQETKEFAQLYMIPGMGHCRGGPGATYVDMLAALDAWVEKGEVPDKLTSYAIPNTGPNDAPSGYNGRNIEEFKPKFSRPVFPFPDLARYSGKGDPNDAQNFRRVTGGR